MSKTGSLILSIDTTSRRGSVAVARAGRVAALFGLEAETQQSAMLWTDVDLISRRLGIRFDEITAFAVVRGPGAFTGVRVGIAAALGFARATGKPLFGATSLELTARAAGPGCPVRVALNAYRNEVYTQAFVIDAGTPVALDAPSVEAPEDVFRRLGAGPLRLVGSGIDAYRDALGERDGWTVVPTPAFLAGELASFTAERLAEGHAPDLVEPCYVRPSEAEVNLKRGLLGVSRIP